RHKTAQAVPRDEQTALVVAAYNKLDGLIVLEGCSCNFPIVLAGVIGRGCGEGGTVVLFTSGPVATVRAAATLAGCKFALFKQRCPVPLVNIHRGFGSRSVVLCVQL